MTQLQIDDAPEGADLTASFTLEQLASAALTCKGLRPGENDREIAQSCLISEAVGGYTTRDYVFTPNGEGRALRWRLNATGRKLAGEFDKPEALVALVKQNEGKRLVIARGPTNTQRLEYKRAHMNDPVRSPRGSTSRSQHIRDYRNLTGVGVEFKEAG